MGNFIKTHSNYTLQKKHKRITGGDIFENDYMTLQNLQSNSSEKIPVYGESNFKMTVNSEPSSFKMHKYGEWEKNICDGVESEIWTLNCIPESNNEKKESIIIKPNYKSLIDFAYYGSAQELIKNSVEHIISIFPGELYFSDKEIVIRTMDKNRNITAISYGFEIDNPFFIDVFSRGLNPNENKNEDFRFLCQYYDSYSLIRNDGVVSDIKNIEWPIRIENRNGKIFLINDENNTETEIQCFSQGQTIGKCVLTDANCKTYNIYQKFINNAKVLVWERDDQLNKYHLRPSEKWIIDYFNSNLSDFEKILLNTSSSPLYKSKFETYEVTDTGMIVTEKDYVWPSENGWNLDISSIRYSNYIESLLDLAIVCDEFFSDNLWRSMTHESIKNFDKIVGKDENELKIASGKIEQIVHFYGNIFDRIRVKVNSIADTNAITYNQIANTPDYFLKDALEMSGWEISYPFTDIAKNIKIQSQYDGEKNKEYSVQDIYFEFLRRLKLNTYDIMTSKGTIDGIKKILGIFGIDEYNQDGKQIYDIKEYTIHANPIDTKEEIEKIENTILSVVSDDGNSTINSLSLPIYVTYKDDKVEKITPFFSNNLYGNPYFQMYGGWGYDLSNDEYNETVKYLKIATTIDNLLEIPYTSLNDNDIYYVNNISNYNNYDGKIIFSSNNQEISNYFIFTQNTWKNVDKTALNNTSYGVGKIIDHLNKIIDEHIGNSPHNGNGKYDLGEEYLNIYKNIFKAYINDGTLNEEDAMGFSLSDKIVSDKITIGNSDEEINIKNIDIIILEENENFIKYFKEKVLPYVKQLIPSTTIWRLITYSAKSTCINNCLYIDGMVDLRNDNVTLTDLANNATTTCLKNIPLSAIVEKDNILNNVEISK